MKIILGSQSPRRAAILGSYSLPFECDPSGFDESTISRSLQPETFVVEAAKGKSEELRAKHKDAIVITSDTIVYHEGTIYGKPETEEEGFTTLKHLAGKWHTVFTGIAVSQGETILTGYEATKVLLNELSDEEIRKYHRQLHCWDKAAAYAIQGAGGIIVKAISGCYFNVVGLPVNTLRTLLLNYEIDLWDYIKN